MGPTIDEQNVVTSRRASLDRSRLRQILGTIQKAFEPLDTNGLEDNIPESCQQR